MPDLTDSEAIEALFDSTSGHLAFSPSLNFSKQDTNTSYYHPKNSPVPFPLSTPKSSLSLAPHKHPLQQNTSTLNLAQNSNLDCYSSTNFAHSNPSQTPSFTPNYSPIFTSQEETTASPVLCRSISCFDLIGTVGCGSYGKVLLGNLSNEATGSNSLHAIKVLSKRYMHRDGVEEVKRELRALRWIADTIKYSDAKKSQSFQGVSFLQKMSESFQNDNFVFLVLEYHPVSLANPVTAARLRLHTPSNAKVPISKSLPISLSSSSPNLPNSNSNHYAPCLCLVAAEMVLGLLFLHQSGIVHQDIKPANIMVSSVGHVVIADFGASASLPFSFNYDGFPVLPDSRATKTFHSIVLNPHDLITFTPLYAAPELVRRNRAGLIIYDSRADWWSFGVLMYELATGNAPFLMTPPSQGGELGQKMKRRSLGDFSLTFGAMEKLVAEVKECDHDDERDSILQLQALIRALLVDRVFDRLSGEDVKNHTFFSPISHLWNEIAALEYPPLPSPPEVSLDPDTSLGIAQSPRINPDSVEGKGDCLETRCRPSRLEGCLRVTWPVPREGFDADDSLRWHTPSPSTSSLNSQAEMAPSLRKTISVSVNSLKEKLYSSSFYPSNSFLHLDDVGMGAEASIGSGGEEEENGADSPVSPLQPFPSTASLYPAFMEQEMEAGTHPEYQVADIQAAESDVDGYSNEDTDDEDDVEIWNPWIPRPDEHIYPSESYGTLPNPYSPQPPPLHHPFESTVAFQSLNSLACFDVQSVAKSEPSVPKDDVRTDNGDTTNDSASSVLAQEGETLDIPDIESLNSGQQHCASPDFEVASDAPGSSNAFVVETGSMDEEDDTDLSFFRPRRETISLPMEEKKKRRSSFQYSLSRVPSIIERPSCNPLLALPDTPMIPGETLERPKLVESAADALPHIDDNHRSRGKQTKKRFSFSGSFSSSGSKKEQEQDREKHDGTSTQNAKRRFSAPLHFPTRGPPSSFTAAMKHKSRSLLVLPRSRSRSASAMKRSSSSSTTVETPVLAASPASASPVPVARAGDIGVLPFSSHELDRMRNEYQTRRATDPFPLPYTPRNHIQTGHAHTATLGRSTGTKMMAQANALAMRRGHYSDHGYPGGSRRGQSSAPPATPPLPKWSPFLENELTKAVLIAMDSGDIGNRDFTVATGTMNTDTNSRAKTRGGAQTLHVSTEADMRQGQPAVEAVPMTSSSRLHRSSWAGIMTSKGCGTISRKEGKEVEMRARRACSFSGVHGVREDTGATGATEEPARIHAEDGILGLAFEDPFHRLSTPQQRKPQSQSSQHTGNGSRRLHKRRPISVHNEEGWTNGKETTESKVKNAAKRRSLGSRLWKKFKRLTSF